MTRTFTALAVTTVLVLTLASFRLTAADSEPAAPAAEKPAPEKAAPAKEGTPAAAAEDPEEAEKKSLNPAHLKLFAAALGAKPGVTTGKVHTLTLPRADLDVRTVEMGEIPTEAGLASTFRLFRCGCGKYYVVGEFCVVDYESNDVIDSLRKGQFQIASVAPMLIQESPKLVLIRFQGEGHVEQMVKTFNDAVQWVGENRTKTNPIPKE